MLEHILGNEPEYKRPPVRPHAGNPSVQLENSSANIGARTTRQTVAATTNLPFSNQHARTMVAFGSS